MVSGFSKGVTTASTLTAPVNLWAPNSATLWRDRHDVRTVERPQRVQAV